MKKFSIVCCLCFCAMQVMSQVIAGRVLDAANSKPLEYVNLGVVGAALGTVTDANGEFSFDLKGQPAKAVIRISMIGYKAQTFSVDELSPTGNIIKLINVPIELGEVTVKPFIGKLKKVGVTGTTPFGPVCGLGGTLKGRGHEIGTKIELGTSPVLIKSFHLCLRKQSFESSLFRLHIRKITNDLPSDELLSENIMIPIAKSSGWIEIDLSQYNLVFEGDIALSLEWVSVNTTNKIKYLVVNDQKIYTVLFKKKQKQGCTYTRWGSEAKWDKHIDGSPSFYLTVQE